MKRFTSALLGTAVLALGAAGCGGGARVNGQVIAAGSRPVAPVLDGESVDGRPLSLAGFAGRVVVVNQWASWCAPCRAEAPDLQQVATQTAGSGVAFVGIDVRDAREAARAFTADKGISYPSFFDQAGVLPARFRALPPSAIPSTVVLDRHGRVAVRFVKPVLASELLPVVERLAAEA